MFDEIKNTMLMETLVKTISLEKIEDHVKKNYKLIIPVNEAVEDIIAKEEMKKKLRPNYVATL